MSEPGSFYNSICDRNKSRLYGTIVARHDGKSRGKLLAQIQSDYQRSGIRSRKRYFRKLKLSNTMKWCYYQVGVDPKYLYWNGKPPKNPPFIPEPTFISITKKQQETLKQIHELYSIGQMFNPNYSLEKARKDFERCVQISERITFSLKWVIDNVRHITFYDKNHSIDAAIDFIDSYAPVSGHYYRNEARVINIDTYEEDLQE